MKRKPVYIDLFAGCGGLSLGLHKAGWKGLFAIERSPDAFETLEHNLINKVDHFNWPKWLGKRNYSIQTILKTYRKNLRSLQGKVDLVAGGPPCQGFSTAGKRNERDKRNGLIKSYISFIKLVKPRMIFFENVKGFTMEFDKNKSKGKKYSEYVISKLDKAGYYVYGKMVDFSEYGIPQKRSRFILVGIRKNIRGATQAKAQTFFQKMHDNKTGFLEKKNLAATVTLGDAISDLLKQHGTERSPDTASFQAGIYSEAISSYQQYLRGGIQEGKIADSHRFVNHTSKIVKKFRYILKHDRRNKSISDLTKLKFVIKKRNVTPLDVQSQSPTLTTLTDDYIHYCEPRVLTVREYARIQSFPDTYEFKGKYTTGGELRIKEVPRYTQIGNAIPPLFSEQSGIALKEFL